MPHKIKIIIGTVSIFAIISIGLFFLNRELPGCFSPNFFSKIRTDVGCFEITLDSKSDFTSVDIQEVKNSAKDYYKRIFEDVKNEKFTILCNFTKAKEGASIDYIDFSVITTNFENKHTARYFLNFDNNSTKYKFDRYLNS